MACHALLRSKLWSKRESFAPYRILIKPYDTIPEYFVTMSELFKIYREMPSKSLS